MKTKKALFLMIVCASVFVSFYVWGAEMPAIVGVYEEVPGQQFVFDGERVEIVEFLSFYCSHCYHFEKSIPVIKGNFPKKILWKTIPIYWSKDASKREAMSRPGEAYFLADDAGKGEEMKKALFEAVFLEKRDIGQFEVLEDIGAKVGLGFDFSRRLRAGEKAKQAAEALEMANTYFIDGTPTVIIAGNIKTHPYMLNNSTDLMRDNVILILKSLFKK